VIKAPQPLLRKRVRPEARARYERWKARTEVDTTRFCTFCECATCKDGPDEGDEVAGLLTHALTDKGDWICDVCYQYECCVDAGFNPCSGPCDHRPVLAGPFEHKKTLAG